MNTTPYFIEILAWASLHQCAGLFKFFFVPRIRYRGTYFGGDLVLHDDLTDHEIGALLRIAGAER